MKDGMGSPFVKFYFRNLELQDRVESFKYKSSEADDECVEVNLRYDDRNAPDLPQFQEGAVWTMIFGFIGGITSDVVELHLQEVKPEYDDQNVLFTLTFTERAISTKQRSHSKVYTKTSIIEILHDVAKVHGLNAYVEIPGQYTKPTQKLYKGSRVANSSNVDILELASKVKKEPLKIQLTDKIIASVKAYNDKKVSQDELDTNLFGSTDGDIRDSSISSGQGVQIDSSVANREDIRNLLISFNTYGTIPVANRTDKQVLNELVKRQPDGPYFIDSHNSDIVLKRRHFDKPSHRSFTWAEGDGELLAFQPESKNRSKKGTSVSMTTQGWDKLHKKFLSVSSDAKNESNQNTLAKTQEIPTDLNAPAEPFTKSGLTNRVQFNLAHDSTNVVKVLPAEIRTLDGVDVVNENTSKMAPPPGNNVSINDPTISSPAEALTNAGNNRRDAELKNNPGYIEIIGDPTIQKGQIVTLLGVSKKYSGNYYIKTVTHSFGDGKEYITRCDLVRQGVNIKTKTGATAAETGKTVSTTPGPTDGVLSGDMKTFLPRQSTLAQDNTRVIKVLPILKPKK